MSEKKYGKCIEEGRHNYELISIEAWGYTLVFSCKNCEYEHKRKPNKKELRAIKLLNIDDQETWEYKHSHGKLVGAIKDTCQMINDNDKVSKWKIQNWLEQALKEAGESKGDND